MGSRHDPGWARDCSQRKNELESDARALIISVCAARLLGEDLEARRHGFRYSIAGGTWSSSAWSFGSLRAASRRAMQLKIPGRDTSALVGPASPPPTTTGPGWFQRMDRNHDGEISRREFLGPRPLFDRYDKNGDGVIEPGEATGE